MSLDTMAAKGERKLQAKLGQMEGNYQAAIPRAQQNFSGVGFGPRTTEAYRSGVAAGASEYGPGVRQGLSKWRANWIARVSQ